MVGNFAIIVPFVLVVLAAFGALIWLLFRNGITGPRFLAFMVCAFGLIMGMNFFMAYQALHTFPGLETENGYVASQNFNRDRAAQLALHWQVKLRYERGNLIVAFDGDKGNTPDVNSIDVLVGRPTEARDDKRPTFTRSGNVFSAPVALHPGRWMVVVQAKAGDGTAFRQRLSLFVES